MTTKTHDSIKTVADLAAATLKHLAGRDCVVRWERPPIPDLVYDGMVDRLPSGRLIIYVDPIARDKDLPLIVAHEAAHVRLHGPRIVHGREYKTGDEYLKARKTDPVHIVSESQAETLTGQWLSYAEKNYKRYGDPGDHDYVKKLYCLLDMAVP